jgi:hypothetical protein
MLAGARLFDQIDDLTVLPQTTVWPFCGKYRIML